MEPDFDPYREVTNGPGTYLILADQLLRKHGVIVGWTDGEGTHYDILFTLYPSQYGSLQGGLHGPRYLFVSIIRVGCFGFAVEEGRHPNYVAEKLGIGSGSTATKVTELLNGVCGRLLLHQNTKGETYDKTARS